MTHQINILTHVDPDIYFDVNGLPDPFTIDIPLGITNNESIDLYFKATLVSPPTGWSDYEKQLGSVGAGSSAFFMYSPKRSQPTLTDGELDETITLKIEAYTDSGYTNLYGEQTIQITVHFFDHADASWTTLYHDDFDDGTTQDWKTADGDRAGDLNVYGIGINDEHYISAPYGAMCLGASGGCNYKDYTVGTYTKAIIIIHIFTASGGRSALQLGDKLILPGAVSSLVTGKWIRICSSIPVGTTTRLKWAASDINVSWIDEIWVIAK